MDVRIPSFLIGLLVGVGLITAYMVYSNGKQLGELSTYISSREIVICTK